MAILQLPYTVNMPVLTLPAVTYVVPVEAGVVIVSPMPGIAQHRAEIEALGKVVAIVAPNLFHHLGVADAMAAFADADLWGAPGFAEKKPALPWAFALGVDPWPYPELVPHLLAGAPKLNEVVFFHPETKALIVTDLVFHHLHGSGLGYWLVFHAFGTYRRFAVSRMLASLVKDKAAFAESLGPVFAQPFDTLHLPHGEDVTSSAKERLRAALQERGIEVA